MGRRARRAQAVSASALLVGSILVGGCGSRATPLSASSSSALTPSAAASAAVLAVSRESDGSLWLLDVNGVAVRELAATGGRKEVVSWSADGHSIAFSWDKGDGRSDIYVVDAVTATVRQVTQSGGALSPAWSPRGDRLAYSDGRTHIIAPDGSGHLLLAGAMSAEHGNWSPDGRRFCFMSLRQDWDIWVVGLDGSGLQNLTHAPGYQAVPAWSPDGTTIAFGADMEKRDLQGMTQAHIYAMNPDGTNVN